MNEEKAPQIAALNDQFRQQGPNKNVQGQMFTTAGIAALTPEMQARIVRAVQTFSDFTPDNDPHGEHDFGAFSIEGAGKIFWKIDYYADREMQFGSEDPADPAVSFRVLTIMLASEY